MLDFPKRANRPRRAREKLDLRQGRVSPFDEFVEVRRLLRVLRRGASITLSRRNAGSGGGKSPRRQIKMVSCRCRT